MFYICDDIGGYVCDEIKGISSFPTFLLTAVMIVAPFFLGSLSLGAKDEGKKVLEIGLGGGSFNMALKKLKPEVNITVVEMDATVATIAYRWFDVRNSERHKVVVQDGITYLKTATSQGYHLKLSINPSFYVR
ncbi:hypothetical protein Y032_0303g1910 [Ancylostoma ceylanicum]|uniref:PABS domain-containing protein n=1 Tax=Ancylostoma ceylanicum TaxID=53326 RepID=A0A016S406_9BILA|nr:hypothetical protein Y032_0303g1910 [Ancylostoma ceylanicum]